MIRTPSAFTLIALALSAACATEEGPGDGRAGPVVLAEATEAALDLLAAPGGPMEARGVEAVDVLRVHVDVVDMAHVRVRQAVGGVPVWGSEAIVHFDASGRVVGITDDLLDGVRVDPRPALTALEAVDLAANAYGKGEGALSDDPLTDLWVVRVEGADHLAWRVRLQEMHGTADDAMPVSFVDAHTGVEVWRYDDLRRATCSGTTNYYGSVSFECYTDGTSWYTEDTTRKVAAYSWNNTTNSLYYVDSTSTTFPTGYLYENAVEAHYSTAATWDYYQAAHGRNGIDGAGGPGAISSHGTNFITSTTSYFSGYANAFWDTYNLMMVFGDGDGSWFDSLTTLDIAGHELTHGVTDYESNLTYSGEPGHLNESTSDVFGAMVERSVLGESADTWLIGEDAYTPGTSGDALRYMNDPAADGYSKDYYSSSIGSVDVHYGSGVPNLVFYLLSEGGTHPRGKSTIAVTGIGADDAADIWYLANTSYLTSSSSFSAARTAHLSAASALFGSSSTQYTQVGNAWVAVGVGSGGSGGSCTPSTYSASITKKRGSSYQPSSSGTSVTVATQTASLTGPSGANFDLYLQKKSGSSWSTVASSTGSTSTESLSYTGSSGTYRALVYARTGTGSYSLSWCK